MKTIYFAALQAAYSGNYSHIILPNTTLNEKYGVGKSNVLTTPVLKYFGVGLKSGIQTLKDGVYDFTYDQHEGKDGNVFIPIPIRLVPLETDLEEPIKRKYRMRKEMIINGIQYVAYYLKVLTDVNHGSYLEVTMDEKNDGVITRWSSVDSTILNPIPKRNNVTITQENFKALAYTKPYTMSLDSEDIVSMINASKLLYDDDTPEIGEYMVCSGVESTSIIGNVEADGVQASVFINQNVKLEDALSMGYDYIFELGGLELMKVSPNE